MRRLSTWLACVLLALVSAVQAEPLRVSGSGTFNASAPLSGISAPGATWSFSFLIDSQPSPLTNDNLTGTGLFTTLPFSGFVFLLDGVAVALQPTYVSLYNANNGGGMDIYFTDLVADPLALVTALSFYDDGQYYTGDEFTPTVLTGSYATSRANGDGFVVTVDSTPFGQGETVVTIALPLPGTVSLVLLGLVATWVGRRRR